MGRGRHRAERPPREGQMSRESGGTLSPAGQADVANGGDDLAADDVLALPCPSMSGPALATRSRSRAACESTLGTALAPSA